MCSLWSLSTQDLRYRVRQENPGPRMVPVLNEVLSRCRYPGASRIECHIAYQAEKVASYNMHCIYRPMWPSKVASHFTGQRIRLDCALIRYCVRDWRQHHKKCDSLCTDACATVCTKAKKLCFVCADAPVAPATAPEVIYNARLKELPSKRPDGQQLLKEIAEYLGDSSFMND